MDINQMIEESHRRAVEHGWWETAEDKSIPVKLALIHSEVSEALEEYRRERMEIWSSDGGKPEGFPIELADIMIRVFDLAGALDIDLEAALRFKSNYNEARPYRHGGRKV